MPDSLEALLDEGLIEAVVRPLMSGKEAQVYVVVAGGVERVAKVYKEATERSFKHRSAYTEGRQVRNTRDARAMGKGSRYGRARAEDAWRAAEVDVLHRLRDAGVRVPEPYRFTDGILIMELVKDAHGRPAPRLAEVELEAREAREVFDRLLRDVVKMLAAGVVHGDLSDFNVLMGADGPVVIDFPQAVDAASNQNARELLIRDVGNLTTFLGRFEPTMRGRPYGQELWDAYERGQLTPDMVLTGNWRPSDVLSDISAVLSEIGDAERDELRRRGQRAPMPPRVREVVVAPPKAPAPRGGHHRGAHPPQQRGPQQRSSHPAQQRGPEHASTKPAHPTHPRAEPSRKIAQGAQPSQPPPPELARRRRRRRRRSGGAPQNGDRPQ